jgi:hypothetical protein
VSSTGVERLRPSASRKPLASTLRSRDTTYAPRAGSMPSTSAFAIQRIRSCAPLGKGSPAPWTSCLGRTTRVASYSQDPSVVDEADNRSELETPEAYVVPRTFFGSSETIEPTQKIFVAIATRLA